MQNEIIYRKITEPDPQDAAAEQSEDPIPYCTCYVGQ